MVWGRRVRRTFHVHELKLLTETLCGRESEPIGSIGSNDTSAAVYFAIFKYLRVMRVHPLSYMGLLRLPTVPVMERHLEGKAGWAN
jgi:hypothetical protein